ncbi:MAG: endonuclease III domain-containing protein [Candidatus Sulfotelmatobacter sp.]
MPQTRSSIPSLLDRLEKFYGPQEPSFPVDPYEFLVWWHCGYPASDAACEKGWTRLRRDVGIEPEQLLKATPQKLAAALKPGGMFPELRAQRLKEVVQRIENEFAGDLRGGLAGPIPQARKNLKKFPGIADPGADRILLFAGITPIAAVPSNCVHVLERIVKGSEGKNYSASYREQQRLLADELPAKLDVRTGAYLLLKRHGQELCKRSKPKCEKCPVSSMCTFFAAS